MRERIGGWLSKPFVFFSIIMLFKIYLAKIVVFEESAYWLPLITDLPSVLVFFALIEWFSPRRKFGWYVTVNLLLTSIYFAVIMYFKYFGVIVTYHALQQAGQVTEVRGSVMSLLHPYFLLIFVDIVAFWLMMFSRRFRLWGKSLAVKESKTIASAVFGVALAISIANVWAHRDTINELNQAKNMGIVNYEANAIIASVGKDLGDPSLVTPEAIAALKKLGNPQAPLYWGQAKGKNVVIIQLEAFQTFLLNTKIDGQEITPVLNQLMKEHFYFPHFYQQVGQGNTSDAEFVVNTSFYIPQHGAASQDYGNAALPSMPKVLSANGYQTATFHTNDVQFWNRKELYKALGFDKYYDASYYGDEDLVFFGSSDEVLYDRTADELLDMSRNGKPFYAQLISMSAHHPFDIPERKISFKLPERYEDTLVGDYIQAENYADYALGQFFDKLKQNGLWDKTVFVIYGDHLGLPLYSLSHHEKKLMEEIYGRPYHFPEMLNIPLIIAAPEVTEPKVMEQTGGQVDIFPTIANLLGVSLKGHIHFGQDLLNEKDNLLPQRYYLPSGSFVNNNGIFVPGYDFEDGSVYPFAGAKPTGAEATEDEFKRALELLKLSDSYVGNLPNHE